MDDQRPSKKLTVEFAQRHDLYGGPWAINEVKADGSRHTLMILDQEPVLAEVESLRTALRGISTCSTCEACRGAAAKLPTARALVCREACQRAVEIIKDVTQPPGDGWDANGSPV